MVRVKHEPAVTLPASGSAAPPGVLVGREYDVQALEEALGGLRAGQGRAVALVGDPGTGKSALVVALIARARAVGVPVLAVDGHDLGAPGSTGDWLGAGQELLRRRPGTGAGLVVVVDGLHHLAEGRILAFERLVEAVAHGPVLLLTAYRERQLSPAVAAVVSGAASTGVLELRRLEPLSLRQTRALLGDRPDLEEIHRAAAGNPQYLKVLAAAVEARADVGTAILGELAELDETALAVVRAAAVLEAPFDPELLAAVAGLDTAETAEVLDGLTRLDLVRSTGSASQFALRHRAVADVVYGRLEPGRRLALHRRAEAVLADRSAPITQRAFHVARSADPSRPDHATTLIAAARSMLHSAPATAGDYLEAAMPLLRQGEAHWHETQVLRARAHLLTGNLLESQALFDALRPDSPRQSPIDVSAVAGRVENRLGRYPQAAAIARSGLESLSDHDTVMAAALHTELADAALDRQQYETARQHAGTAAAIARRHQDGPSEANALAQVSLAHLFTAELAMAETTATRAAELVDTAADASLLTNLQSVYQLGLTEGTLGRLTDAVRHLTRGLALSRGTGQTFILPMMLKTLGDAHLRSGDLPRALSALDEVAHHGERGASPATRALTMTMRARALQWQRTRGDQREALALAERALAIADGHRATWAVMVRCFHAEIELFSGDPARSKWLLLEAVGGAGLPGLTTWHKPRWCDILAQVALADADGTSADAWARLGEDAVQQLPSPSRRGFALRARMYAHALHGDAERAVRCAQEAVEAFSVGGERLEVCRTLLAAATLSLDAERSDDVDGWLDRAAYLADQCGAARLTDEVVARRHRFAALTSRRSNGALDTLSAREREIAGLASTGMTSREISIALSVSVRTVDAHLGCAYGKLNVRNRAELTRAVLNGDGPHSPAPRSSPAAREADR